MCPTFPAWWPTHSPVYTCSIYLLSRGVTPSVMPPGRMLSLFLLERKTHSLFSKLLFNIKKKQFHVLCFFFPRCTENVLNHDVTVKLLLLTYSTHRERGQWKCVFVCVCAMPAVPCRCKLWRTFESIFDDCILLRKAFGSDGCSGCVSVCMYCVCLFIGIEGVKGCCYWISHHCCIVFLCCEVSM